MGDDAGRSTSSNEDLRVERRRRGQAGQLPGDTLEQMPAMVVLERLPIPVLAIGPDGAILFANTAFAAMLGHSDDTMRELTSTAFSTTCLPISQWSM